MKSMWQQKRKLLGLVLVLAMMLPCRAALADRACRTYQAVVEGQYTTISREGNQIVLESEQSVLSGSYIIDGDGNYVLHGADRSYQAVWDNDKLLLEGYVVLEPGRDHSFQGVHSYHGMNLEKYYLEMDAGTQTFEITLETDEGIVQLREEDDQLYLTIDENTYTFIRTDE